jgi:hypothetical protein
MNVMKFVVGCCGIDCARGKVASTCIMIIARQQLAHLAVVLAVGAGAGAGRGGDGNDGRAASSGFARVPSSADREERGNAFVTTPAAPTHTRNSPGYRRVRGEITREVMEEEHNERCDRAPAVMTKFVSH